MKTKTRKCSRTATQRTPVSSPAPARLAYSVTETAALLGVSRISVYRLIERGLLRASGALRHRLIPAKEIDRFLAETTTDAAA